MNDRAAVLTELDQRDDVITVRIPMRFERRGGRKLVIAPDSNQSLAPASIKRDNGLIRALGRAHRWQRLLGEGRYGTITELAEAEKVNVSYICRILRLTLLAPAIVEAILNGRQPRTLQLADLLRPLPANWDEQCGRYLGTSRVNGSAN